MRPTRVVAVREKTIVFGRATSILPVLLVSPPETGPTTGDNMTIGLVIAITAVVCAAIGMTTQAETAKAEVDKLHQRVRRVLGAAMRRRHARFRWQHLRLNFPVLPLILLTVTGKKVDRPLCRNSAGRREWT